MGRQKARADDHEIPLDEWLDAFRQAAEELAKSSLRFAPGDVGEDDGSRPGAYIAILSDRHSVHLGLCASPAQCRALARGLLGLRAEASLGDREVVDGVSEVTNILAGKVKSRLAGRDGQLRLGLPMFIAQPIHAAADLECSQADVQLGPVVCTLLVYRRRRVAEAA